ncbi:MAG: FtsQ-type POTRA domain-containing protein [Lentisphaeria bacterium]|nr:FtsQ-type POTRA domain-containing protein [Lentisphaeria bacterium]
MAVSSRNSKKGTTSRRSDSAAADPKRKLKLSVWGGVILLVLGAVIWCIIKLPGIFFSENPRFKFQNLEVDSTGYWQKNPQMLLDRLGLKKGSYLFTIDLQKLRRQLEKIPSIESAEVRMVLPDTLKVKIVERIPRAALYTVNSPAVVDAAGVVMKRSESSAANQRLPVIKGLRNMDVSIQVRPALRLILNALSNYPDIAIQEISLKVPGELQVKLYYRNSKQCTVLFPATEEEDYNYLLSVLQTTILRSGSSWSTFDLRYKGSVSGR